MDAEYYGRKYLYSAYALWSVSGQVTNCFINNELHLDAKHLFTLGNLGAHHNVLWALAWLPILELKWDG